MFNTYQMKGKVPLFRTYMTNINALNQSSLIRLLPKMGIYVLKGTMNGFFLYLWTI